MTGHTPGPWHPRMVDSQEWHIDSHTHAASGPGRWSALAIAYGCDDEPGTGAVVAEANARLIAAAPELLDACITAQAAMVAVELSDSSRAEWEAARHAVRAAIAKATQP